MFHLFTVAVVSLTAVEVSAEPEVSWVTEVMISLPDDARTLTPSTISWICFLRVSTMAARHSQNILFGEGSYLYGEVIRGYLLRCLCLSFREPTI